MAGFLTELRRRKVLRVVAAYIVASWVLLQVTDVLVSILELPAWSGKLVFVMLLVGLVPAIILSWAYDLTPDGVQATEPAGPGVESGPANKTLAVALLLVVVAGVVAAGYWYAGKESRWARNEAMPEIEAFIEMGDYEAAFPLARKVESIIPGDPEMQEIWNSFAWTVSLPTTPAGATVYRRAYDATDDDWLELGTTPLYDIRLPHGASLLRFEADGRATVLRVIGGGLVTITQLELQEWPSHNAFSINTETFVLDSDGALPARMVRVPRWDDVIGGEVVQFSDFFIGRYEVTNREFQAFVDAGGYSRHDLWEHEFLQDGERLSFDEAMALFVDKSGRAGPSTWEAGAYPEDQGSFPVSGISWYEAAAYARFAGYELPTIHHWRRAVALAILAWQLPASNVNSDSVAAVGSYPGIGWAGTFDMAGNVREWCFNQTADGMRAVVGSSWEDDPYMFEESMSTPHRRDAMDRSATNGFRLASTQDPVSVVAIARATIEEEEFAAIPEPVSDEVFAASLSVFDYDRSPLNAVVEETEDFRHWTRERVTIDTADGSERIPIYVYLPKRESSRHKAIMYWGGAVGQYIGSIDQERFNLGYALRNGRAVIRPILKGTYERRVMPRPDWTTHRGRDLDIEEVREFRRVIDYAATRPDIDMETLSYYGHSWGGRVGAQVLAVEPRIKVGVLNQAGFYHGIQDDISAAHFLPRVSVPVLHFSGLYDTDFRFETSSKPFHDQLGTPAVDKKHVVAPTGHFVPYDVVAGEVLDWLDKYQGPVR